MIDILKTKRNTRERMITIRKYGIIIDNKEVFILLIIKNGKNSNN